MKNLKKFLRSIDLFGVPLTFRYKSKDKYSTSLGGFTMVIFCILVIFLVFYYFNRFINKGNFTTIYYTVNIQKTDKIKLIESKSVFTLGLDCGSKGRFKADDVLQLEARYVNYTKTKEGVYAKNKTLLPTHFCTHEDFFNEHNDAFDRLTLHKFQCLDDYGGSLEGVYSDQIFTYYEFSVVSKYNTPENLDNIEEYLFQNDCKLQIVYPDITIDLNNYKDPLKSYLNEVFIQLNPTLYIKRNMFFMNQYLMDDDDILFGIFNEVGYSFITALYSRYEEYSLYLGLNRSLTNPPDKINYAKLYMRADTKKTDIKRTYQNIMEFYADVSSLLLGIFRVLIIIFNFINNFYAEYSFSKRIFIFKEFENAYFDLSKRQNKINQLKSLIDSYNSNNSETSSFESGLDIFFNNEKNFRNYDLNTFNKTKKKQLNVINNSYKRNSISYSNHEIGNLIAIGNFSTSTLKKEENKKLSEKEFYESKISSLRSNKIFKKSNNGNPESKIFKNKTKNINLQKNKNNYRFNIFEIIIISFCKCNFTKQLTLKKNAYNIVSNTLNRKLDIISYIKNMLINEVIKDVILNSRNKDIISFLYHPIISVEENNEKEFNELESNFKENNFDKFYEGILELIQNDTKSKKEKNLILLSQQKLFELSKMKE